VRDRHCQHTAGCDVPADRCDIDHIVPRRRGGPTAQWNGRASCDRQNRNDELRDSPEPLPERSVDRLDELRARIRWLHRQEPPPAGRPRPDGR
jgi:5-methylcytosine-specific restriction endonuclease McrA